MMSSDLFLRLLQNVVIVRARKALIRRDHEIHVGLSRLPPGLRVEIMAVHVVPPLEDAHHFRLLQLEIRQRPFQVGTCLRQLRRRDQIHGIRDLLRITDALDSVFDFFRIRHGTLILYIASGEIPRSTVRSPVP